MQIINWTVLAEADLIDIWIYIAQDNPVAADNLLDEIESKCSLCWGSERTPRSSSLKTQMIRKAICDRWSLDIEQ